MQLSELAQRLVLAGNPTVLCAGTAEVVSNPWGGLARGLGLLVSITPVRQPGAAV